LPKPVDPKTANVEDLLNKVLVLNKKYINYLAYIMARRPFLINRYARYWYRWPSNKQLIYIEEYEDEEDKEGETHCLGLKFIIKAAAKTVKDALCTIYITFTAIEYIAEESEHPLLITHRYIYD